MIFFCQLPEERKLDLLKNLAESSPYSAPQDSRQILPSVVQLLKVLITMVTRKFFIDVLSIRYNVHFLFDCLVYRTRNRNGYVLIDNKNLSAMPIFVTIFSHEMSSFFSSEVHASKKDRRGDKFHLC